MKGAWRALRIRSRVTLWYGGSITVLLLGAAVVFRAVFVHSLSREFDRSLEASAALARGFYQSEVLEYGSAEPTLVHIGSELTFPDRRVEFIRPEGHVLVSPSHHHVPTAEPVRRHDEPLDPVRAPGWRISVVASTAPLARPLRQITELFLLGIPLAVALAGTVGWWLAGRMLRPVAEMAAATEHVVAGAGLRLPVGNPADELGRLGTRFNALLDRLDGALGQQRAFLADAAHELRTPVSRTLSGVELALLDEQPSASHIAALRSAQAELLRTGRLVDELMQLARFDAVGGSVAGAHGRLNLVRVFLDDLVCDACTAWRAAAQQAGVRLTQSAVEETPIDADPVLVERLIGVLVDNAVRYTPAGGTVDVRATWDGRSATLVVADTGIGIEADDYSRATERFFRSSAARAHCPDGSGLGLAIARVIAEAHGAVLTLGAAPGGGTIARVSFPSVGIMGST